MKSECACWRSENILKDICLLNLWDALFSVRDWSLITGRGGGGYKTGGGRGAREVLPLRRGGAEKVLAMMRGGTKSFGVVFTR